MIVFLSVVILLFAIYVLSTACRRGHNGLHALQGWSYAHRGLHGDGIPENSLEAFRRARDAGYGIELDVHLLGDGRLGVMHDSGLKRTTGQEGFMEDLTAETRKDYHLEGTDQTIPLFSEVLSLVDGKVPLIVELKCVGGNYPELCRKTCQMLDGYKGVYCLESFDPRCIYWLRKNRPDVIRGQLSENYFASQSTSLPWYLKFLLTIQALNFLVYPDFVAYKFRDRKTLSNFLARKLWGAQGVTWTLRNQHEHDIAVAEGWLPIFENYMP